MAPEGQRASHIACAVSPLDRKRLATARQLMELFGLTAAEARLARALTTGESLDEYAVAQGVKMPTLRTQLSSIFQKTRTARQATLVALIMAIPVLRE